MTTGYAKKDDDIASVHEEGEEEATNRAIWGTWNKQYDFTITVIGYVLGIHNLWRFPFLCYKYGGAFFVPYIVVLILLGIPMVFMELTVGQFFSVGPTDAFHQMAPILNSVSYLLALNSMINCCLYTMTISWARSYSSDATSCFKGWEVCYQRHFYNTPECYTAEEDDSCRDIDPQPSSTMGYQYVDRLYHGFRCISATEFCGYYGATYSSSNRSCVFSNGRKAFKVYTRRSNAIVEHFYGGIMGFKRAREQLRAANANAVYSNATVYRRGEELVENDESHSGVNMKIYSLTTWFLLVIFLYEGLLSVSVITYFLTALPFIFLLVFTAKALALTQSVTGMDQLVLARKFVPDISTVDMWAEAIIQGVLTCGVGTGVLVTLGTFNKYRHKFLFDAYFTLFLNLLTSACACIICFCTIGHYVNYYRILSSDNKNDGEFFGYIKTESSTSSIEFGYIVYTHFLTLIHEQAYAPFLFFFMASNLATDTALRLVQMALDRVVASCPMLGRHRFFALLGICTLGFMGLFPMTQNGGLRAFNEVEYFTHNFLSPLVTLVELGGFAWIYDAKEIARRAEDMRVISSTAFRWYLIASLKFISPAMLIFSLAVKSAFHTRNRFNGRPSPLGWEITGWLLSSLPVLIMLINVTSSLIRTPRSQWRNLVRPLNSRDRRASRHSSLGAILQEAHASRATSRKKSVGRFSSLVKPDDISEEKWRERQAVRFSMIPNAPLSRRHRPGAYDKEEESISSSIVSSNSTILSSLFKSKARSSSRHQAISSRGVEARVVRVRADDEVIATEGNAAEELWKTLLLQIMSYFLNWPGRFDELSEGEGSSDDSSGSVTDQDEAAPKRQ